MKLLYKGRHIKTMPKEFEKVPEPYLYIDDEFQKRLNAQERKALEKALFEYRSKTFIRKQRENKLLDNYLGLSNIVDAVKVITTHEHYYAIRYEGNKLLKCPREIYTLHPAPGIVHKI